MSSGVSMVGFDHFKLKGFNTLADVVQYHLGGLQSVYKKESGGVSNNKVVNRSGQGKVNGWGKVLK